MSPLLINMGYPTCSYQVGSSHPLLYGISIRWLPADYLYGQSVLISSSVSYVWIGNNFFRIYCLVLVIPSCCKSLTNLVPANNHSFLTPLSLRYFRTALAVVSSDTTYLQEYPAPSGSNTSVQRPWLRLDGWFFVACRDSLWIGPLSPCDQNDVTMSSTKTKIRLPQRT
jgi:hypothetical protein